MTKHFLVKLELQRLSQAPPPPPLASADDAENFNLILIYNLAAENFNSTLISFFFKCADAAEDSNLILIMLLKTLT